MASGETSRALPAGHKVIKEGLASILVPINTKEKSTDAEAAQSVFYNPIQNFNRDLTVLAIKAYGEEVSAAKRERWERKKTATHKTTTNNRKRKRKDDENSQAESTVGEGDAGEDTVPTTTKLPSGEAPAKTINPSSYKPSFRILDALSATGLRALRYALELSFPTHITANDLLPAATAAIQQNVAYNDLTHLIRPTTSDALAHMYSVGYPSVPSQVSLKYDVVDLDPYGTAAPYFEASLSALTDGGLLCATCTDPGVFASVGYPEKTYALYGGVPVKSQYSHEAGLRLILHAIAGAAARHGLAIEPLLSLSIDYYARVFVRVRRSPADVKFLAGKTMVVYTCDSGCGAWTTHPLVRTRERPGKPNSNPAIKLWRHGLAQGPGTDQHCAHCGFRTHFAGPMYAGPIQSPTFIKKIIDDLPQAHPDVYHTKARILGMLTTAMEEELSLITPPAVTQQPDPPQVSESTKASSDEPPITSLAARDTPTVTTAEPQTHPSQVQPRDRPRHSRMAEERTPSPEPASTPPPHPYFFIIPQTLSKVLHCNSPPEAAIRGALIQLGHRVTRSHCRPGSIKTDAPWSTIWEVMREWVRQQAPLKEGALSKGSAGHAIMERARLGTDRICDFDVRLGKGADRKGVRFQMNPKNWGPQRMAKG